MVDPVVFVAAFTRCHVGGGADGAKVDAAVTGSELGKSVISCVDDVGAVGIDAFFAVYCQDAVFVAGDVQAGSTVDDGGAVALVSMGGGGGIEADVVGFEAEQILCQCCTAP